MIEQHQVEKDELNQKIRNLEEEKRALASELSNVQREKTNLVEEHAKTIEELRIEKDETIKKLQSENDEANKKIQNLESTVERLEKENSAKDVHQASAHAQREMVSVEEASVNRVSQLARYTSNMHSNICIETTIY